MQSKYPRPQTKRKVQANMPPKRKKNKKKGGVKAHKGGGKGQSNNSVRYPFKINNNVNMSKIKVPEPALTCHVYYQPTDKNLHTLKKFAFESDVCGEAWELFQSQGRKDQMRALRRLIGYSTSLALVSHRYFCLEDGEIKCVQLNSNRISSSVVKTQVISNDQVLMKRLPRSSGETCVNVISCDTLDMVEVLSNRVERKKIGVLNFASASNPGGGWEKGAGAQEESLCRRSSLICTLSDPWGHGGRERNKYPIPDFGCIYSPDVCIFRKSHRDGFAFYPRPIYADFISSACRRMPPLKETAHGIRINCSKTVNATLRKIRRIFEVAVSKNIECLVLGAWGCGVYANPPAHIALLFKQVINEYNGLIKEIYFAIPGDLDMYSHHNPNGNLQPFANCFRVDVMSLNEFQAQNEEEFGEN